MFGLKLSVRGHQHVFQLEIPELQAFHGKIELGPEIIIMAHITQRKVSVSAQLCSLTPHLSICIVIHLPVDINVFINIQ